MNKHQGRKVGQFTTEIRLIEFYGLVVINCAE